MSSRNISLTKKGQLTLFIILGVLIIVSIIVLYVSYLSKEKEKPTEAATLLGGMLNKEGVQTYIINFMKDAAKDAVKEVALQGGNTNPQSSVLFGAEEDYKPVSVYAVYETGKGYVNKAKPNKLLKQDVEKAIGEQLKSKIISILDFSTYEEQGYAIIKGNVDIDIKFDYETIFIRMNYPLSFQRKDEKTDFTNFSTKITMPIGELYGAAVDIINDEIADGNFNKEEYMLSTGTIIRIEKYKQYPDIVYVIKEFVPGINDELIFRLAIKGKDTVGKEVIDYTNAYGCCKDNYDDSVFKNMEQGDCVGTGVYDSNTNCRADKIIKQMVDGCCEVNYQCSLTKNESCTQIGGIFYEGDFSCKMSNCTNLDCNRTYDRMTNRDTGRKRSNGETWCSYDGRTGKGTDYIGSRQYMHSCINGVEYVEPCRDYREEICVYQWIDPYEDHSLYSKAGCRTNRWYDCYEQANKESCEDKSKRDCYWGGGYLIYNDRKCHPEVPPGFKFWEENGEGVCDLANDALRTDDQMEHAYVFMDGNFFYCQRMGDCGIKYNIIGDITEFGWGNSEGEKAKANYDSPYFDNRDIYYLKDSIYNINYIKGNYPKGSAVSGEYTMWCDLWKPNITDKCGLCTAFDQDKIPCTEYKCKSLGANCEFSVSSDGIIRCEESANIDLTPPEINIEIAQPEYTIISESQDSEGITVYEVSPYLYPHDEFRFRITTADDSYCSLSLDPGDYSSLLELFIGNINEVPLNSGMMQKEYDVKLRAPDMSKFNMDSLKVIIKCRNRFQIEAKKKLKFGVTSLSSGKHLEILDEVYPSPSNIRKGDLNSFVIKATKPMKRCYYSFSPDLSAANNPFECSLYLFSGAGARTIDLSGTTLSPMQDEINRLLNMNTYSEVLDSDSYLKYQWIEGHFSYDNKNSFGSYPCYANIPVDSSASQICFNCEDIDGILNQNKKCFSLISST